MKKTILSLALIFAFVVLMTSCFTYTYKVGSGAKTGVQIEERNHYLIYGLVPIKTSDPIKMADGAQNYTVKIEHSIFDGLVNILTLGIYTPTTTTVTK